MRKHYIEYLRVFSMFFVVALHVCVAAISSFEISGGGYTVFLGIEYISYFAVPVFFMISGALLLPSSKEMPLKKLLKKYVLKYAMIILVFGWFFAFLEEFFVTRSVSLNLFYTSFLNMLQGESWNHMWYMYELLGISLILPALRCVAEKFDSGETESCNHIILYFLIIGLFFLSILPVIEAYVGVEFGVQFPIKHIYILYMFMGFWIDQGKIKVTKRASIGAVIFSVVAILLLSALQGHNVCNASPLLSYSSPIVVLLAVGLFSAARNEDGWRKEETPQWVKMLGNYSFGVYIIHMLWINVLYKLIGFNPCSVPAILGFAVVYLFTILLSVASVRVMKQVPLIKSIL